MAVLNKHKHGNRDSVCEQYEQWMGARLDAGEVTPEQLASLHGRDLVCFCAPHRCHGHSLEKAAQWAHNYLYGDSK